MPEIDTDAQKEVIKEAISEWLDKQFSVLGKWTLKGLLALAFAGAVYLSLKGQGWSK